MADWLTNSAPPWWQLVTFGPLGFEAYARLRYIPDPAYLGQSENDVQVADGHPFEIDWALRALAVLAEFTHTADECFVGIWEGFGWQPDDPRLSGGPLLTLPNRRYLLFAGALAELASWERGRVDGLGMSAPAFVWPADRRWCFTSDVDPHWAGIGGEPAAIEALLAAGDIDVVRADPTHPPPAYR